MSDGMSEIGPEAPTRDRLLNGRIAFVQPQAGLRSAIDPFLLAAALPDRGAFMLAADLGAGAGAASLCLAARLAEVCVVGLEIDPALASLARANALANGFGARLQIIAGDVARPPFKRESFDEVMVNPPYLQPTRATAPPGAAKALASVEGAADLAVWVKTALALARSGGAVTFIHRADRLYDLLAAMGAHGGAGGVVIFPLWPRRGEPAKRVIVRARKGSRAPFSLDAGLVLHEADGRYTPAAEAILRAGQGLAI